MIIKKAPSKKMQASARRATQRVVEDYEEEPSMKLSSAFVVVLLLHLVAVGGIYAFKSIEARRAADEPQVAAAELRTELPPAEAPVPAARGNVYEVQPGDTLIRIANEHNTTVLALEAANGLKDVALLRVGQEIRIPDGTAPAPPVKKESKKQAVSPASGGTYTVVKGDNPVGIARQFGVSYSDLLEINNIDDPRKLQIGQVLKLPAKRD